MNAPDESCSRGRKGAPGPRSWPGPGPALPRLVAPKLFPNHFVPKEKVIEHKMPLKSSSVTDPVRATCHCWQRTSCRASPHTLSGRWQQGQGCPGRPGAPGLPRSLSPSVLTPQQDQVQSSPRIMCSFLDRRALRGPRGCMTSRGEAARPLTLPRGPLTSVRSWPVGEAPLPAPGPVNSLQG